MSHVLDNPIYAALSTGNELLSNGVENSLFFPQDIGPFVGLKENSANEFSTLYEITPAGRTFVLFSHTPVSAPAPWKMTGDMQIWQMVYQGTYAPMNEPRGFVELDETHVPAMLALTKQTDPGPFLERTIQFGNYIGFIQKGKLVSMAGQRLKPSPYIEISAVCTHPDHIGKGYASKLVQEQVKRISQQGDIPFLHVKKDNVSAIKVYERLGFSIRRLIYVSIFQN